MRKYRNWPALIKQLPPGLTYYQAARRLKVPYTVIRYAIHRYRYRAVDGRSFGQRVRRILDPDKTDWRKSDLQIARELLISKQRVNRVRHEFHNGQHKRPLTKTKKGK